MKSSVSPTFLLFFFFNSTVYISCALFHIFTKALSLFFLFIVLLYYYSFGKLFMYLCFNDSHISMPPPTTSQIVCYVFFLKCFIGTLKTTGPQIHYLHYPLPSQMLPSLCICISVHLLAPPSESSSKALLFLLLGHSQL